MWLYFRFYVLQALKEDPAGFGIGACEQEYQNTNFKLCVAGSTYWL
jgi:hypothetical protein